MPLDAKSAVRLTHEEVLQLLPTLSLEDLARAAGIWRGDTVFGNAVMAEFTRRQTIAQIEAATATTDTAKWTKWTMILTAVSVFILAVSSAVSALLDYLSYLKP